MLSDRDATMQRQTYIELVLALCVAYLVNGVTGNFLYIQIYIALYLTGQHYLSRGHEGLTSHFTLWIEREEIIYKGIAYLVCYFVWVSFRNRFACE